MQDHKETFWIPHFCSSLCEYYQHVRIFFSQKQQTDTPFFSFAVLKMSKKSTVRQKSVRPISKGYGNVSKDPALSTRPTLSSKLSGVGEVENAARIIFSRFVAGASESNSQWYSVKPISNGIPSMSELFGVNNTNLERLLILAGLAYDSSKKKKVSQPTMLQQQHRSKTNCLLRWTRSLPYSGSGRTQRRLRWWWITNVKVVISF